MKITEKEVRYVADLANLSFSDDEVRRFARELDGILEHMDKLNELDTANVEPMAQVLYAAEETATLRPDRPRATLGTEAALANAPQNISAAARIEMLRVLADAIGTRGMAGGQAIDLESVKQTLGPAALERMHRQKTGALIQASVLLGAACAGLDNAAQHAALAAFGAEIGLAFQIQDDILDVEGQTDTLGKRAGADAERVKPTYPSVLGLARARSEALSRRDRAVAALAPFGQRFSHLAEFAHFLVARVS